MPLEQISTAPGISNAVYYGDERNALHLSSRTPFVFSLRCIYDIWENVAQGEQLYWEKQSYREEKSNYETVHPFKKLIPEILLKSGVQIHP